MKFCPHCGRALDKEDYKTCPHCQKSLEIKEQKTASPDHEKTDDELVTQVKDAVTEGVKGVQDKVDKELAELREKMNAIENLPFNKSFFIQKDTKRIYKGYNLEKQGLELRHKMSQSRYKHLFTALNDDEKFFKYAEWVIDMAKAVAFKDIESIMKLQTQQKASNLVEGTDNVGGYTVPVEYQDDLILLARELSFALQKCTVVPMNSNTAKFPSEASMVTAYWAAEAVAPTASNPTFGQVDLTAKKLGCLTAGVSKELLEDSLVDIVGLLTQQMMYAQGLELDNQVLNGTGDPCSGVLTAAAGNSVVMATGSTNFSSVAADNFRDMIRKLAAADSADAEFIYSKDIQYYVDVLKDSNGNYIYREPAGEKPARLWSRGIFESSKSPLESASGASTAFGALGKWSLFYIGRRRGTMAIEADPYTNFTTDLIVFKMITRWALAMARSTAFCRLVTAA